MKLSPNHSQLNDKIKAQSNNMLSPNGKFGKTLGGSNFNITQKPAMASVRSMA